MNIEDTFVHNGLEYTVVSIPEEGRVNGRGQRTIVDSSPEVPDRIMYEMISILVVDITP